MGTCPLTVDSSHHWGPTPGLESLLCHLVIVWLVQLTYLPEQLQANNGGSRYYTLTGLLKDNIDDADSKDGNSKTNIAYAQLALVMCQALLWAICVYNVFNPS